MNKKSKKDPSSDKISGHLIYSVDEDGEMDDSFLLDNVPKASSEIKEFTRKKLKALGVSDDDIDVFLIQMK